MERAFGPRRPPLADVSRTALTGRLAPVSSAALQGRNLRRRTRTADSELVADKGNPTV